MEEKNIPIEKKIFRDVYIFYKKYAVKERTDEYWEEVTMEMGNISNFYKGNILCRDLLVAVFHYLENMQQISSE